MEQPPPDRQLDSKELPNSSAEPRYLDKRSIAAFAEVLASSGVHLVRSELFSGPLPSPKILEEYKKIAPELLDTIIKEYKQEGPQRRNNEEKLINHGILMARLGLVSAFLITLFFLSAGFYLILKGHDIAGASICGAGLVSVVVAFLRHTSSSTRKSV
jgi:uncharacterized membrane protein